MMVHKETLRQSWIASHEVIWCDSGKYWVTLYRELPLLYGRAYVYNLADQGRHDLLQMLQSITEWMAQKTMQKRVTQKLGNHSRDTNLAGIKHKGETLQRDRPPTESPEAELEPWVPKATDAL